jgi:hypothetical protein
LKVARASRGTATLELNVAEMRQLFNAMDPAPFRERDLDPNAVSYIVDWAHETDPRQALALVVYLGREAVGSEPQRLLGDAVHEYFQRRASAERLRLRRLFRDGRISLVIGIVFIIAMVLLAGMLSERFDNYSHGWVVSESLIIVGWVALWRPLEIFLYDWWPMRAQARLYDRLGTMDVTLRGAAADAA